MNRRQRIAAKAFVLSVSPLCFFIQPVPPGQGFEASRPTIKASDTASPPLAPTALHPACTAFVRAAATQGWRLHIAELERIAWRESRCQSRTTNLNENGTTDWGILQINDVNIPHLRRAGIIETPDDLFDPAVSARAARSMRHRDGGFCSWQAPDYC
jgi:hypothetical protein